MVSLIAILATVLVLSANHRAAAKVHLTVDLGYSTNTGILAADNKTAKWLGIRYAAPPLGDLRFMAPQYPFVNDTIQSADKFGNTCLPTPPTVIIPGFSGDCLFLNIFAPFGKSTKSPVYVYFQGGGFVSNSAPHLDGTSLIEAGDYDMVVVNFNNRVGPWGFLASKEVQAGGDLNTGILDQRFVLEWVQEHIHRFGGDPTQVTIGGCSAGVLQAAAESQSFGTQYTVEEAQYQYDGLVAGVGCNSSDDTLQCLRDTDVNVIAKQNSRILTSGGGGGIPLFAYSDVIDGTLIQDYTYNLFATNRNIKISTIFGAVTNDGTIFTPTTTSNYKDVDNFLKNNFPKLTADQLATINYPYPQTETFPNSGPYWRTAANAYGDMRYMCPGIWLSIVYDLQDTRGWNYLWDVAPQSNLENGLGVIHCDQSDSIFGSATQQPEVGLNPIIQAYWTSFIRTGDPNTFKLQSAPTWTKMEGVGLQRMHFVNDTSNVAVDNVPADYYRRCNYLTTIAGSLSQ